MNWRVFKNGVVVLLIVLFVCAPILELKVAEAQTQTVTGGYSAIGGYKYGSGGVSGGLSAYLKGLGPAITQLPLCRKKISSGVKNLFSGGASKALLGKEASKTLNKTLGTTVDESQAEADAIHSYDAKANEKLDKTVTATEKIDKKQQELLENDTCLKSIGRMVVKMMLQKITMSTVAWIQGGFDGGPAFIQNPGRFFGDIAKTEILGFGLELNVNADCKTVLNGSMSAASSKFSGFSTASDCVSPYAKAWFKSQAEAYNKKFIDNARYSLNELIADTTPEYNGVQFSYDFTAGGWNAWTALTAVPANNPLGFNMLAQSELSARLRGTKQSTAEQIQAALVQSNGYLGDYRCADPEGMTKEQDRALKESGQGGCVRWEYVTPGAMVAKFAEKVTGYQDNNLLKAQDLNDAVAAIIDALLARLSTDLMQQGFAGMPDDGADGGIILNSYALEGNYTTGQVEKDFPEYLQGSDWLQAHPNFNIRTDITQAIIDEQRVYVEKLEKQNAVLARVINNVKQLDYCIPGPSPEQYRELTNIDLFDNSNDVKLKFDLAEFLVQFDPTGIISGIASAILEKNHEKEVKKLWATNLGIMFGVHIYGAFGYTSDEDSGSKQQDQIMTLSDAEDLGHNVLNSYHSVIHNVYFNGSKSLAPMPSVTYEARKEFDRIEGYQGMIEDNDDQITILKPIIKRLSNLKDEVESFGPVPNPDDPNYQDYESNLKPIIAEFGRLTDEMVTGDDIAKIDKLLKELDDKEIYIKNNLLATCEKESIDLYNSEKDHLTYSKYYRRQPYGEPIEYLYGLGVGNNSKAVISPVDNSGKLITTAWSEDAVKKWNIYDQFLYGSVYWNFWARPYDGGHGYIGNDYEHPQPPNLVKIAQALAVSCPEFIDVVQFSKPGPDGSNSHYSKDLGGLEPAGGGDTIPYGKNECGVMNKLERKLIGIY